MSQGQWQYRHALSLRTLSRCTYTCKQMHTCIATWVSIYSRIMSSTLAGSLVVSAILNSQYNTEFHLDIRLRPAYLWPLPSRFTIYWRDYMQGFKMKINAISLRRLPLISSSSITIPLGVGSSRLYEDIISTRFMRIIKHKYQESGHAMRNAMLCAVIKTALWRGVTLPYSQ
jgi:hypothetical protein